MIAMCAIAVMMTSCLNDGFDDFERFDNRYLRTGCDLKTLEVDTLNSDGAAFIYRIWVEPATKPIAEVELEAGFENVNTEVTVSNFIIGTGKNSVECKGVKNHKENYFTVTDSVMIYQVCYDNFTLEYKFPFQTAYYNDGKTSGLAAYLKFDKDIVDNGYVVSDLQNEVVDGNVYMRKLFRHSVFVKFNGQKYHATATVILKHKLGSVGEDFVVKTTLEDSGIKEWNAEENKVSYLSWMKVTQTFQSGKTETELLEVRMYGKFHIKAIEKMKFNSKNFTRLSADFDQEREHMQMVPRSKYVDGFYYERPYVITYTNGTVEGFFEHVEAQYNDGFTVIPFPCVKYEGIADSCSLDWVADHEDTHGRYSEYLFSQSMSAKFGTYVCSEKVTFPVVITR